MTAHWPTSVRLAQWFYTPLTLILLIAMGLRCGAAVHWHHQASPDQHYFRLPDSHGYWTLAQQIGRGLPYEYGSPDAKIFRTPMLPLLLAPLTWIPDPYWAVLVTRLVGAVLGTVAVLGIALLAGRVGGPASFAWAGLIAAAYPSAIGMSVVVLSEMLFLPLMVFQLLFWLDATGSPSMPGPAANRRAWALAFASGSIAGVASLTRPSWLLFTPCLIAAYLLWNKVGRRQTALALLALAGMCLAMNPWWIRNASITNKWVLTTLQVGPSLLDGLRSDATGASDSGMEFMVDIVQRQRRLDSQSLDPLESTFEWRVNRLAAQEAVRWATKNPDLAFQLALRKFARIWSFWPDGKELASHWMRLVITVGSYSVLTLAVIACVRLRRLGKPLLASLWLPCLYFTALHVVFVGSIRYREPAVFLLIVLAAQVYPPAPLTLLSNLRRILCDLLSRPVRSNLRWQARPLLDGWATRAPLGNGQHPYSAAGNRTGIHCNRPVLSGCPNAGGDRTQGDRSTGTERTVSEG